MFGQVIMHVFRGCLRHKQSRFFLFQYTQDIFVQSKWKDCTSFFRTRALWLANKSICTSVLSLLQFTRWECSGLKKYSIWTFLTFIVDPKLSTQVATVLSFYRSLLKLITSLFWAIFVRNWNWFQSGLEKNSAHFFFFFFINLLV